jgi:peptidoglycan/xylan/chitin deacetylase (PgdA/CDA1 family)
VEERTFLDKVKNRIGRISALLVRTRTIRMVNERPIVSFTFDDCPASAARIGAKMLEDRGLAGTFYLSQRFCGAEEDGLDYYDRFDLEALADKGHEIGCHTASHLHVPATSTGDLVEDIDANAAFIRENLGDIRMTTFAFPFGEIDLRTKFLMQNRFAACRTTEPGVNRNVADLGALRAEKLYWSRDAQSLRALLKGAATSRSWLILYTHDVSDNPSRFGCNPAMLEAAIGTALSYDCNVLPVRNALGAVRFHRSDV